MQTFPTTTRTTRQALGVWVFFWRTRRWCTSALSMKIFRRRRRAGKGTTDGGQPGARSAAPVALLATCMIGVLYGNASSYWTGSRAHPSNGALPGVSTAVPVYRQEEPRRQLLAVGEKVHDQLLQPGEEAETQRKQEQERQQRQEEKEEEREKERQERQEEAPDGDASNALLQPGELADAARLQQTTPSNNPSQGLVQPGNISEGGKPEPDMKLMAGEKEQAAEGDVEEADAGKGSAGVEERKKEEPAVHVVDDGGGGGAVKNGAVRGEMQCASTKLGEGVDNIVNIATWKDVPGDASYRSPLAEANVNRYVTLEKDLGGFNNIRLSLECGVAFAAATGRTFVIPPPFPIWNMNTNILEKVVDLGELFTFDKLRESGRVSVITTEEFLAKEASTGALGLEPGEEVMRLTPKAVHEYMVEVASQYEGGLPELRMEKTGLVMPRRAGERVVLEDEEYGFARAWLYGRTLLEYREAWEEAKVIHWRAKQARLLAPFYAFILHGDEVADRYHKRLLRDLMHYPEEVYCKASQIVSLLRQEDPSGDFSTFHVRRNDFRHIYKQVFIDMPDVIKNSAGHLYENEVVYVATDEKNLTAFEPFKKHVRVKFLSDFYERAGVSELNPNLIGMLEQIIASHGRTFTGCWLSTFTAYILRLRGHLGKPRTSNWSYFKPKRTYHHTYRMPENPLWSTEWPLGWEGIDETGVPDPLAP